MATRTRTSVAAKQIADPESAHEPGLVALLAPKDSTMVAVEKALLRGGAFNTSPPIAEQIAARVAGLIALDLLKPGQRLLETDISDILHVSRAPVREAIRILERDNLVELSARRGAAVTAPDAEELQDIFEVRTALYAILLEQIMRDRHTDLQSVFEQFLPRLEQAARETPQDYAVQSFLFNLAITDLCSNRLVVDQLKATSLRTLRYVRLGLSASPESIAKLLKGWHAFHGAVVKRDIHQVIEVATRRIASMRDLSVAAVTKSRQAASPARR